MENNFDEIITQILKTNISSQQTKNFYEKQI